MDPGDKGRDIVARLRAVFALGGTLQGAAGALGKSKSALHRLAQSHGIRGRWRWLSEEQDRQLAALINQGLSERQICRQLEVGKGTVNRRKASRRKRLGLPKVVKPYRCSGVCGQVVTYLPCQICIAMDARAVRVRERAKAIAGTRARRLERDRSMDQRGKSGQEDARQ